MNRIACVHIKGGQEFIIFTETFKGKIFFLAYFKKQRKLVNHSKVEFVSDNINLQKLFVRLLKIECGRKSVKYIFYIYYMVRGIHSATSSDRCSWALHHVIIRGIELFSGEKIKDECYGSCPKVEYHSIRGE